MNFKEEPAFSHTEPITMLPMAYSHTLERRDSAEWTARRAVLAFVCTACLLAILLSPTDVAPPPVPPHSTTTAHQPWSLLPHSRAVLSAPELAELPKILSPLPPLPSPTSPSPSPPVSRSAPSSPAPNSSPSPSVQAADSATHRATAPPKRAVRADDHTDDSASEDSSDDTDLDDEEDSEEQTTDSNARNDDDEKRKPAAPSGRARLRTDGGYNVDRLVRVLVRAIRTNKMQSVVDISCYEHATWLPSLLQALSSTEGGWVRYFCVSGEQQQLQSVERKLGKTKGGGVSVHFVRKRVLTDALPAGDVVFSWDGLRGADSKAVRKMLDRIKKEERHAFVMVGSAPGVKHNEKGIVVNFRRAPFSYGVPMKIYKEIAVRKGGPSAEKHLYLYKASDLLSHSAHHAKR